MSRYAPDQIEFSVFCIESLSEQLQIGGNEIYDKITSKSDILDGYIIPNYEVLHSQGKEYIVGDITEIMRKKGIL